jgi:hypothetical protein
MVDGEGGGDSHIHLLQLHLHTYIERRGESLGAHGGVARGGSYLLLERFPVDFHLLKLDFGHFERRGVLLGRLRLCSGLLALTQALVLLNNLY